MTSKNQNPREGIEMMHDPATELLRLTTTSKNQNPREGIEI